MLNVKQFKQQYISNQRQECGMPQLNMKYMAVGAVLCLDLGLHVVNTMFLSLVPLINFLPHIVWFSGNSFCTLFC